MHPGKGQQRTALAGSAASDAAPGGIGITGTDRASASVLSAQGWPLTAECSRVACPQGAAGLCAALGCPAHCMRTATDLLPAPLPPAWWRAAMHGLCASELWPTPHGGDLASVSVTHAQQQVT